MKHTFSSVLISGGSRGIGKACAKQLAENGVTTLILTGRSAENLAEAKKEIEYQWPETSVFTYQCDQDNADDVQSLVHELKEKNRIPDTIIANIGNNPVHEFGPKKVASTSVELFSKTLQTNLINMHLLIAPMLKFYQRQPGRIALVGSQAYQAGIKGQVSYNVSKSALVGYKNTIVSEYGEKGVFCHLINPGVVKNQRTEKLREQLKGIETVSEQTVAQVICDTLAQNEKNGLEINI